MADADTQLALDALLRAKDQTIAAKDQTIQALMELVNTQRAIPTAIPSGPAPADLLHFPPLEAVDTPGEDEVEEIMAQMNDPDLPEDTAERLMTQLQALNTRVERG